MSGLIEKDIYRDGIPGNLAMLPCECIGGADALCCVSVLRWIKDPENAADLRALIAHKAAIKSAKWIAEHGAKAVEV